MDRCPFLRSAANYVESAGLKSSILGFKLEHFDRVLRGSRNSTFRSIRTTARPLAVPPRVVTVQTLCVLWGMRFRVVLLSFESFQTGEESVRTGAPSRQIAVSAILSLSAFY